MKRIIIMNKMKLKSFKIKGKTKNLIKKELIEIKEMFGEERNHQ